MTFARQFVIYGVAGAFSRLASFLLVPLYTRTLSQLEYGRLEILLSLYMLVVLLVGLQGESAVAREYFLARKESREREIVWTALVMAMAGLVLTGILTAGAIVAGMPAYLAANAGLILATAALTQIMGIQLLVIRFADRPRLYAIFSVVDVIVTAASSVALIVWLDLGPPGALGGLLVGKAIVVGLAWPLVIGMPRQADFDRARLAAMAAYSLPTMPAVLLNWLQTVGNRIVWSAFFSLGLVAVASVGMRATAAVGVAVYAFRLAWEPFAFRLLDEAEDPQEAFAPVLGYVAIGALAMGGLATLAGPLLTALFAPPQYREAAGLIGILMMNQVWLMVMLVTSMGIHGARVTSRLTWIYSAGLLANLAVLALLAPVFGLTATAWGTLAGSVVTALLGAYISNSHFGTGFSFRLLALLAGLSIGIGATVVAYPHWQHTLWPHPFVVLATVSAIAVLWWIGMEAANRSKARKAAAYQFATIRGLFNRGAASGPAGRSGGKARRDNH